MKAGATRPPVDGALPGLEPVLEACLRSVAFAPGHGRSWKCRSRTVCGMCVRVPDLAIWAAASLPGSLLCALVWSSVQIFTVGGVHMTETALDESTRKDHPDQWQCGLRWEEEAVPPVWRCRFGDVRVFSDGSEVEEWAFYRGEAEPVVPNDQSPASRVGDDGVVLAAGSVAVHAPITSTMAPRRVVVLDGIVIPSCASHGHPAIWPAQRYRLGMPSMISSEGHQPYIQVGSSQSNTV